jgi:hypothetical protein
MLKVAIFILPALFVFKIQIYLAFLPVRREIAKGAYWGLSLKCRYDTFVADALKEGKSDAQSVDGTVFSLPSAAVARDGGTGTDGPGWPGLAEPFGGPVLTMTTKGDAPR